MAALAGQHVAFLTQDAVPADEPWLQRLLGGFAVADDVGLVFGPYRARADASPMVARELHDWFASFSPDGRPAGRPAGARPSASARARELLGARGFFTDANGCVSRAAWEQAPFRDVPFAEDHVLAHDMLRAGLRQGLSARRGRDPLPRVLAAGLAAAELRRGAGAAADLRLGAARRPALAGARAARPRRGRLEVGLGARRGARRGPAGRRSDNLPAIELIRAPRRPRWRARCWAAGPTGSRARWQRLLARGQKC